MLVCRYRPLSPSHQTTLEMHVALLRRCRQIARRQGFTRRRWTCRYIVASAQCRRSAATASRVEFQIGLLITSIPTYTATNCNDGPRLCSQEGQRLVLGLTSDYSCSVIGIAAANRSKSSN
jgi:hypothetical protein